MVFNDFIFMMQTKAADLRIYVTADVFCRLWRDGGASGELEIVLENIDLLREAAADRIEASGFSNGVIMITTKDIEP